jgi:hypothetical protein
MIRHNPSGSPKDVLLAISGLASISDVFIAVHGAYFMWGLSTLKNPLTMLMIMRTFGTLIFAFNMFSVLFVCVLYAVGLT